MEEAKAVVVLGDMPGDMLGADDADGWDCSFAVLPFSGNVDLGPQPDPTKYTRV